MSKITWTNWNLKFPAFAETDLKNLKCLLSDQEHFKHPEHNKI